VHSATHEEHLVTLDQVLQHLLQCNLKINLQNCVFRSKEVSNLVALPKKASNQAQTN
jgi:hypothetical protein